MADTTCFLRSLSGLNDIMCTKHLGHVQLERLRKCGGLFLCSPPLSLPVLGLWGAHGPDGLEALTCSFCPPAPPGTAHLPASRPSLSAACQEGLESIGCMPRGGSAPFIWNPLQTGAHCCAKMYQKVPIEVSSPKLLPQAWLRGPGSHMPECIHVVGGVSPVPCAWTYHCT